ncbi:MAG TPA: hypothetical protein P5153_16740 [Candidatus Krumholzibacteria bacterium]|nr:hypothetical protein [Candidatus Krumholzibacteria bacterium]
MSKQPNRKAYMVLFPKPDFMPQYQRPGDTCTTVKLRFVREEDGRIVNIGDYHDPAFADAVIHVFVSRSKTGIYHRVSFEWADIWSLSTKRIKAIAAFDANVLRRLRGPDGAYPLHSEPNDDFRRIMKAIGVQRCARYVKDHSSSYSECTFQFGDIEVACQMFNDLIDRLTAVCADPA